jgi:hypothetical protein
MAGVSIIPDVQALKDDLDHIDHILEDCFARDDPELLSYAAQFLNSLGRDADSKRILAASEKLKNIAQGNAFSREEVAREFQIIQNVVDGRMAETQQVY